MKTIKNALLCEDIFNQDINIITKNLDDNNILNDIPVILSNTTKLLQKRFHNMNVVCILNCLLTKTAQMITSKRVMLKTIDSDTKRIIPNWYAIIFMPSGYGKDMLNNNLDDYIFHNFREAFKIKADEYKRKEIERIQQDALNKYNEEKKSALRDSYIKTESEKIRNLILEMTDGTQEGFYCDCKAFECAKFGSAFLKFSEFGAYLNTITTEKEQFINCLLKAYDGQITSKCIKGSNREPDIENMPVNALMYSDYTYFKSGINEMFDKLMKTGICRRAIVSFQAETHLKHIISNYENESNFLNAAKKINEQISSLYFSIQENSCYTLEKQAFDNIYIKYKNYAIDKYNECDDDLLKKEIHSRPYKVLKLSCLYACFNHSSDLTIKSNDLLQAIKTVEFLSRDLKAFADYKPFKKDKYDNVFNFFLSRINEPINKSDLTVTHYREFGFSRRSFAYNFENIIKFVSEIAESKGYVLQEEKGNKNKITYMLTNFKKEEQTEKTYKVEDLINASGKVGKIGKTLVG